MDLINNNLLDNGFSNASGCGLPPVCTEKKVVTGTRQVCVGKNKFKVCKNVPTVKTVVNQKCIDDKARYKACMADPNRKKLLDTVKATVKAATTNIKTTTKAAATNIKTTTKKAGANVKKKVVKLKDKVGAAGKAFRNKFRATMRKGILFNIKHNIHGTASKLYPAVATDGEVASRKYKKSYVGKSRGLYGQVANKWRSLGGNESDLKSAIREGSSKGFLKAPYKSFNGDDSYALYLNYIPSNRVFWTNPNDTFYWGATGYDENGYDENGDPIDLGSAEGVYDPATDTEEVPSQEEELHGIRAFFAWLKGLFGKNQANENPYAEGTAEYAAFESEKNGDAGNEPDPSEANNPDITDLEGRGVEDGAGTTTDENAGDENNDDTTDTIFGIPKVGFWIGVSVLVLVGGYFAYTKLIKKK